MWKIALGFIAFAALGMFVIIKGGSALDMSGEKHGSEPAPAATAPAAAPAAVTAPAAPAAPEAPASAAK